MLDYCRNTPKSILVMDVTPSENNRNMVFIPETPANISTMKGNWNKHLPCLDGEQTPVTESKENTFFVLESQNTPRATLQTINTSTPSNEDFYYLNKSRSNYISNVRDTCEQSFCPVPNCPEKAELDDSSFLAPTQVIPNNSYIDNSVHLEKKKAFASRAKNKENQSNRGFPEISLLKEETQKIGSQIKCLFQNNRYIT